MSITKLYSEYMRKKYNAKITYIPHGFILGKDGYTKNNEGFSIGIFGFISPYKDYETVLKVYRKLKKIDSNISLKIIGGPHPDFPEIYDHLKTHLYDGIKLTYTYHHCKLLVIMKIADDATIPGVVKKLYVPELGNNTHIYTLFIDDSSNLSADQLSYPMELENGWNVIAPHNIKLESGEYVYMALLIIFDGGCGHSCIDHNPQESDIQIHIPWRVPGACIGSWESNQDITITSDYS